MMLILIYLYVYYINYYIRVIIINYYEVIFLIYFFTIFHENLYFRGLCQGLMSSKHPIIMIPMGFMSRPYVFQASDHHDTYTKLKPVNYIYRLN